MIHNLLIRLTVKLRKFSKFEIIFKLTKQNHEKAIIIVSFSDKCIVGNG